MKRTVYIWDTGDWCEHMDINIYKHFLGDNYKQLSDYDSIVFILKADMDYEM